MPLYNVEWDQGQTIIEAKRLVTARNKAWRLFGEYHAPYDVWLATKEDIAHVEDMGGKIHYETE